MERLSIDEIIAHCKREVTIAERTLGREIFETGNMDASFMKLYWEHRQVAEYLKELKAYRELEEKEMGKKMDIKKFAEMLNGKEHEWMQFTEEEIQIAKDNGFVIVYGASDDLMEFAGAICDEAGCFDGGKVYFDKNGASQDGEEKPNVIEALWCDDETKDVDSSLITWTYKTDIPHETFMIYEEGASYCMGIVFDIKDLK